MEQVPVCVRCLVSHMLSLPYWTLTGQWSGYYYHLHFMNKVVEAEIFTNSLLVTGVVTLEQELRSSPVWALWSRPLIQLLFLKKTVLGIAAQSRGERVTARGSGRGDSGSATQKPGDFSQAMATLWVSVSASLNWGRGSLWRYTVNANIHTWINIMEHPLCVRHCSHSWQHSSEKADKNPFPGGVNKKNL